jgi:hypothetical protein
MPTPIFVSGIPITGGPPSANIRNSQNTYHFHVSAAVQWSFAALQVSANYQIHAYKSTDNGATWAEQDVNNGPSNRGVGPGIFWDGANTVYIAVMDATPALNLYSFDLVAGTFGAQVGPTSPTLPSFLGGNSGFRWLIQFSDLSFRVFYVAPTSGNSNVRDFRFIDFDGATWSNDTSIDSITGNNFITVAEIQTQGDVQHIIYAPSTPASTWKYIRIDRAGATSSPHTFPTGDKIALFGGTLSDGVYESDNDEIVFPAIVLTGVNTINVAVYRGTPTSAPVWTGPEIAYTENLDIPTYPTLVRLANGTEQLFFIYYPVSPNQDDGFNSLSAIATVTKTGASWSALSQYYNLAIDPFSNPDPGECISDQILNLGVEVYGGAVYLQFDGFSGNFSTATLRQPNFGFAAPIPPPTCSLSGSPLTITLGDSSTLSWTTTGTPDTATIDNGVGSVDPSGGSVSVSPTETTTYILTVTNGSGSSTCQVTITVIIPPPPVSACDSIVTDFFRYQLLYDRWLPGQLTKFPGSLEDMIYEPDTGELMLATFGPVEIGDQDDDRDTLFSYVDKDGTLGTSDDWLGDDGIDGTPISTRFKTGFFYLDSPALDKLLQDIILEIDNPIGITCLVYYDYSDTPDPSDTFVIPGSTDGRRRISLLSQVLAGFSEGKEFYSVAFEFCWTGVKRVTIYGLTFHYEPLALAQTGMIAVWDKGTADWDKKVYECTIEYTNYGFPDLVASLDTMSGIDSLTQNLGVATFPLPETTPGARARVVFPVYGDVVYKLRRLSLFNGDSNIIPIFEAGKIIRIYDVKYQEEALPPDIVPSTPWNDFGSPWDKVPRSLMISADTGGFSVPVTLQNEYGNVVTVNHTGTFVSRPQDYAVPPDNFGKLWRLVALPPAGGKFEMDKWDMDKLLDPPTHIVFTDWSDQDWVAEKIARNLHLTVDTGGIQAQVQLMADGTVKETFLITTTYQDRRRNLNCASDLLGKMWRLLWVPGINGRVKLWNWLLEGIKEPVPTTLWDSYEQAFGYQGWKAWKLMSLMYISPSPVNITIYRENKEIFFSVSLPAHAHRDIEQVLLPSAVSTSLNKSRTYRIVVTSDQPCKFYLDASRIEFLAIGAARHQVLQQKALSEILETTAM